MKISDKIANKMLILTA